MSYNKYPWSNFHGFNLDWVIDTVKECKEMVDGVIEEVESIVDDYVTKDELTNKRRLSKLADFTGTWFGDTHTKIVNEIEESKQLSQTLIDAINARESIGLIYDGKTFPFVDPLQTIIDGGVF